MVAGVKRGRHSRQYVVTPSRYVSSFADHPLFLFLFLTAQLRRRISPNYLTNNNTRRTLTPSFFSLLMTSRYYPSFALLSRALHPAMTVSTNACLKLGLPHDLFPFSSDAVNGRK